MSDADDVPDTWPEQEAWLRKRLADLPPDELEKELALFEKMFERFSGPNPVRDRHRELLNAALEPKKPEERRRFLDILEKSLS